MYDNLLQQSLQEALAQSRQGFVPSLAVDVSALHAVSNNKYTSISRCCQECVPVSKVSSRVILLVSCNINEGWIKCGILLFFFSSDQVLLGRFCQRWFAKHADSWQEKAMVSYYFFVVSIVVFHSIPLLCCDAVLHSILSLCFIPGVCLVASFPTLLTSSSRISDTAIWTMLERRHLTQKGQLWCW